MNAAVAIVYACLADGAWLTANKALKSQGKWAFRALAALLVAAAFSFNPIAAASALVALALLNWLGEVIHESHTGRNRH